MMKRWADRIVCAFLILACLIFLLDAFFFPGNVPSSLMPVLFITSIAALIAGGFWLRHSFGRKVAGDQNDMGAAIAAVSKGARIRIWAYWIACLLLTALHCVIIVLICTLATRFSSLGLQSMAYIVIASIVAAAAAAFCLFSKAPFFQKKVIALAKGLLLAMSAALSAAFCYVYLSYLPKFSYIDGLSILRSDSVLATKNIGDSNERRISGLYDIKGNPFLTKGYLYSYDLVEYNSLGLQLKIGVVFFDPVTGTYTQSTWDNQVVNPKDCPEFDMKGFICNDFKNVILNLVFHAEQKVRLFNSEANNTAVAPGNARWDECMDEITGSLILPHDQAFAFIREMGEEQLKEKIMAGILYLDYPPIEPTAKEMTIDVLFYGIHIATYQNGEIALEQ